LSLRNRKKKKLKKSEQSQRDLKGTIKHTSMCIVRVPEGEEREERQYGKNNDQKLSKFDERYGYQEARQIQRSTLKRIMIKDKGRILKTVKEKSFITYK
jgi:hypothetical protein